MSSFHTLPEIAYVEPVLVDSDIGGTADTSKYVDMTNYGTVTFWVLLGNTVEGTVTNWSTTDSLDNFYLLQATDSAGTGAKVITGANCDQTDAQTGTAGNIYAITCNSEAMDMANDFTHVAAYVVEDTNTAADIVQIYAARYNARYKHDDLNVTTNKHVVV
jgi:hypothetical protein